MFVVHHVRFCLPMSVFLCVLDDLIWPMQRLLYTLICRVLEEGAQTLHAGCANLTPLKKVMSPAEDDVVILEIDVYRFNRFITLSEHRLTPFTRQLHNIDPCYKQKHNPKHF